MGTINSLHANPFGRTRLTMKKGDRGWPGTSMRRNAEPSHYARHKYTGHLNVHTTVLPKLCKFNRARLQNVFNWPATFAVYAAIPCKVKTKSPEQASASDGFDCGACCTANATIRPQYAGRGSRLNPRGARRCPQFLARRFAATL